MSNPNDVAYLFSGHFSSSFFLQMVFTGCASSNESTYSDIFTLDKVTIPDIMDAAIQLKLKLSSGLDCISNFIVKGC